MQPPAIPADEEYRLAALHQLRLLDTPPEDAFEKIVALGQSLFDVPTCLVSLIDSDRQWFKARTGLGVPETPRAVSFCGHAIHGREIFVILDARKDERFHDNPVVTGPPFLRFYAGAPIWLPSGYAIGTVCLLSPDPRQSFDAQQQGLLAALANLALEAITARALRQQLDRESLTRLRFEAVLDIMAAPVALADGEGAVQSRNAAFTALAMRFPDTAWLAEEPMRLPADLLSSPELDAEGQTSLILSGENRTCVLDIYRDAGGYAILGRE
ncbi:GAF domain-containing protein [Oceanibaculum nanhaiense]|uniref:GAF domain-containing protein n=1 Tax=Oceanibaculum nanhaiense TaxID=1909734 RepID=UPI00396EF81B